MGRTLKRVALDFSWPLNKTWKGFLNPFWDQSIKCTECDGSGQNIGADILYNLAYVHQYDKIREWLKKSDNEALNEFARSVMSKRGLRTRFFNNAAYYGFPKSKLEILEPFRYKTFNSEEELLAALEPISEKWDNHTKSRLALFVEQNSEVSLDDCFELEDFEILLKHGDIPAECFPNRIWYRFDKEQNTWVGIDRSSSNREDWKWEPCEKPELPPVDVLKRHFNTSFNGSGSVYHVTKEKAEKEGWTVGYCNCCNGDGHVWPSKEVKDQFDNWTESEPPAGDGFQLWETTSEGSPTSPVFETLDALCEYAAENCYTFADYKASKEEWKQMLGDDMVVTPMLDKDGNKTGVVFI